ncbi:hypothetical protein HK405_014508, partial [Cladochytrium tenue]
MATVSAPPCKFFQSGSCRAGAACKFSHQQGAGQPAAASPLPGGVCQFFVHQKPAPATASSSTASSPSNTSKATFRPKAPAWLPPPPPMEIPPEQSPSPLQQTGAMQFSDKPALHRNPMALYSSQRHPSDLAATSSASLLPNPYGRYDEFDAFDPTLPPTEDDFLLHSGVRPPYYEGNAEPAYDYEYEYDAGAWDPDDGAADLDALPANGGLKTYSDIAKNTLPAASEASPRNEKRDAAHLGFAKRAPTVLCPFAVHGICKFGDMCRYTHGEQCPKCFKFCLDPAMSLEEQDEAHVFSCTGTAAPQAATSSMTDQMDCVVCFERV